MDVLVGDEITFGVDVLSWIVFVEVPAFLGLVLYILRSFKSLNTDIEQERLYLTGKYQQLSDKLALYKLEVAQKYASFEHLKDVENRLTNHLIRIEEKLDKGGRT